MTITDPHNINEDGNNPYRAAYGGLFNWDPYITSPSTPVSSKGP
ncbi:MAG: hypothetical protein OEY23_17805 [Acidimicrobiia bacterium]|nr:hypothetical protein [Acidimicrobiia bacterium]